MQTTHLICDLATEDAIQWVLIRTSVTGEGLRMLWTGLCDDTPAEWVTHPAVSCRETDRQTDRHRDISFSWISHKQVLNSSHFITPSYPFTHSLIHPLTHSLIHPLTHSLTHSLTNSPTHWAIYGRRSPPDKAPPILTSPPTEPQRPGCVHDRQAEDGWHTLRRKIWCSWQWLCQNCRESLLHTHCKHNT